MLEVAERTEVEQQEDGHDLAVTHRGFPHATFLVITTNKQLFSFDHIVSSEYELKSSSSDSPLYISSV